MKAGLERRNADRLSGLSAISSEISVIILLAVTIVVAILVYLLALAVL